MAHGALHQRLGGDAAVFRPELPFQRAAVDANADGDAPLTAGVRHGLHPLLRADVAGVDADGVHAPLRGHQGQAVAEMDVRHQGDVDLFLDLIQGAGRRLIGHGHPDDLAARLLQPEDLGDRGRHIIGLRIAHGLDAHRGAAAHGHRAHVDSLRHGIRLLSDEFEDIVGRHKKHEAHQRHQKY